MIYVIILLLAFNFTFFSEAAIACVLYKKLFLNIAQYSQEDAFVRVLFIPTQMFSCEYYEIFKSVYFEEYLRATASALSWKLSYNLGGKTKLGLLDMAKNHLNLTSHERHKKFSKYF